MTDSGKDSATAPAELRPPEFGSNAIRLSLGDWAVAAAVLLSASVLIPKLWKTLERFRPPDDYRIPYELSEDYWHYRRACEEADTDAVLVLGDSVVWGAYVPADGTLAHWLGEETGRGFANLGVNGIHPVALDGLVRTYGRAIADRTVLIHYNPLWMSSPRHDLRTSKEFRFNHPRLVPQFVPRIPCYREPVDVRAAVAIERCLRVRAWAKHLSLTYFGGTPLPAWSIEHPYESPFREISLELPSSSPPRHSGAEPWTARGIKPHAFDWVAADDSLQWRFFRDTVLRLRTRGNRVFALVGPLNEHMIAPQSRDAYGLIKARAAEWLHGEDIPHMVATALPSALYADASHPLAEGYRQLARQLADDPEFRAFAE